MRGKVHAFVVIPRKVIRVFFWRDDGASDGDGCERGEVRLPKSFGQRGLKWVLWGNCWELGLHNGFVQGQGMKCGTGGWLKNLEKPLPLPHLSL